VADLALARGAHGVGQSSWGPTVFALVESDGRAHALADEIRATFGDRLAGIEVSRARNRGASCREFP
jgi:predicted sugar kinase